MIALVLLLAAADAPDPSEIDALLQAGRLAEAKAQAKTLAPPDRDAWLGRIALQEGDAQAALQFFAAAQAEAPDEPSLSLHRALAHLALEAPEAALVHAQAAAPLDATSPAPAIIEARAWSALDRPHKAYARLAQARTVHGRDAGLLLELGILCHRLSLVHETRRLARLAEAQATTASQQLAWMALVHRDRGARALLERWAARHPNNPQFSAHLAHHYAQTGHHHTAARLFERASAGTGRYAFEAADQYRVAGAHTAALRMNRQISDAARAEQASAQKLSILFAAEAYDHIAALAFAPTEPALAYRVAYADYATGQRARARHRLRGLLSGPYRAPALALLKAMERTGP